MDILSFKLCTSLESGNPIPNPETEMIFLEEIATMEHQKQKILEGQMRKVICKFRIHLNLQRNRHDVSQGTLIKIL